MIATIAIILHLPGLANGPTLDGAIFTELGVGLRSGLLLYRDLWDHKPPGVYVAFALAQSVLPGADPWLGPWMLTVLASTLVAGFTYLLLMPVGSRAAVVGGVVTAVYISLYPIALGGGQTEPLATVALLAAFVLASRSRITFRITALIGVLAAVAVTLSLLVLPTTLALAILVGGPRALTAGSRLDAIKRLSGAAIGATAVAVCVVVALAASGSLADAWSALVVYNGTYGTINRMHTAGFVSMSLVGALLLAPLLSLCAMGALRWRRTGDGFSPSVTAAAAWVIAGSFAITVTGRLEPHYLIVLIPPLVLLAVPAGRQLVAGSRARKIAGTILVAGSVAIASPSLLVLLHRTDGLTNQSQLRAVSSWLRAHAAEGAELFAWGDEPGLYYTSGLGPATRYVHVMPILTPGYGGPEFSQRVADDLTSDLPQFVVDAGSARPGEPGTVPLLVPRPVVAGDGRTLDTIEPIREVVRDYYGPPVEVAGWLIYQRLPAVTVPTSVP